MPIDSRPWRRIIRVGAAAICAATLVLGQGTPASATSRTVSFEFLHTLETKPFPLKYGGKSGLLITKCIASPAKNLKVTLWRSRVGLDTAMGSQTINCKAKQRAEFLQAPLNGSYYFELKKIEDGELFKGTAVISY
ncbi:hypothetical protein [Actinacidiphila glaucinigra]|uniref:Uncharacterized protein n=1 Tax=Actinacidiphila glaucinigra TaxID=235986 RepID=A0A239LUN8_9ACTN|nr:hypothetical protein [Actinacidiphila glaucinigra]SNT34246.1 hypothetical protein SAMN05216252_121110 [Actinacidiphila glaucinigra]